MCPQTPSALNQNASLSAEEWVDEHCQAMNIDPACLSLNESDASGQCLLPENWDPSSECSTQFANMTLHGAPDGYSHESTQTAFPSIPTFSHDQQQPMSHSSLQSPSYSDSRVLSQFAQFGMNNFIPHVAEVDESLSWNPPPAAAVQSPDLYYGIPASLPSGSSSPFNMQGVSHFNTPVWNQNTFHQVESVSSGFTFQFYDPNTEMFTDSPVSSSGNSSSSSSTLSSASSPGNSSSSSPTLSSASSSSLTRWRKRPTATPYTRIPYDPFSNRNNTPVMIDPSDPSGETGLCQWIIGDSGSGPVLCGGRYTLDFLGEHIDQCHAKVRQQFRCRWNGCEHLKAGARAIGPSSVKNHLLSHGPLFSCTICSKKSASRAYEVKDHIWRKHPDRFAEFFEEE